MRKKKILYLISLLVFVLLLSVGCTAPARPAPQIEREAPDREINDRNE